MLSVAVYSALLSAVQSFSFVIHRKVIMQESRRHGVGRGDSSTILFEKMNEDEKSEPVNNEELFEKLCENGAVDISNMDVAERTKRAMLAELVEDTIFNLEEKLEQMIGKDGKVPEDEKLRERCVSLARQIKDAQGKYESLVSGAPSDLLNSLVNIGSEFQTD